ncbi:hypothetical protein BD408DRAFT_414084 [Parasitella parasitica]|nr:hypothetical protein BD408DRAFT_414084 [Parasitella parasitica]
MDRPQPPDAFSRTLDSKPRHSYISQVKQQHAQDSTSTENSSTVNRLSRVFEANQLLDKQPKPIPPSKPPSLSKSSNAIEPSPRQPPPPPTPHAPAPPSKPQPTQEAEIDETSLVFKDIRARFQQDTALPIGNHQPKYRIPVPLMPSKTGPPAPEKVIIAAKTGPPALPLKPKTNSIVTSRYPEQLHQQLPPFRGSQYQQQQPQPNLSIDTTSFSTDGYKSLSLLSAAASPASSMLHIPAVISRTTTGNSSIISSTSTSSQNSTSTSSKRGWHISSWFTNQQQQQQQQQQHEQLKSSIRRSDSNVIASDMETMDLLSPEFTGSSANTATKREKVIDELLETEKAYQKDMSLLKYIYYDGALNAGFSKMDMRHLFSNLTEIVEFEKTFVTVLEHSCEQDSVGASFRETMRAIDSIYSEYCKRQEDAVLKLQELELLPEIQAFLNECKEKIQGKTTSWDLGSLLIKPVQRVLKYPLLLREILSLTPPTHIDHDDLSAAVKEIQEVADNINEIKRRKDIVERIVGDKKKTDISVVHGINKRFTRRAQKFKQVTGLAGEPTHDIVFEALLLKFEEQQELVRQLARDVQGWVRHIKIGFENLQQLACSMESLYGSWGGVRVKSLNGISDFSRTASYMSSNLSRELDSDVRGFVYSRIDDFLRVFDNPTQVIHKRALKMIDYDRVRDIKLKGDIPDKALQESADAYVSINGQLVDELPKFFNLTAKYFDVLTGGIALVQLKFFGLMQKEWIKLIEQNLGMKAARSFEAIIANHMDELDKVENIASKISILHKSRYASSIGSDSPTLSMSPRQRSGNLYSPRIASDYATAGSPSPRFMSPSTATPPAPVVGNLIDLEQDGPVATPQDFNCIVLYDFEMDEEDRLNVKRGTILRVSQDEDYLDQDWWFATTADDFKSGWVPINYCKKL